MKIIQRVLLGIIFFCVSGCEATRPGNNNTSTNNYSTPRVPISAVENSPTQISPAESQSTSENEISSNEDSSIKISIPDNNDKAPDGILEQLAWPGQGGGGLDEPCGECSIKLEESSLTMKKFHRAQRLNLHIYRYTGGNECGDLTAQYVTSLSLQVDENGYLYSTLSGPANGIFVMEAFDLDTSEMVWHTWEARYINMECSPADNSKACPGAPLQRLEVNKTAYVCTTNDSVKLREGPGKNYSEIKSLVPGADITVIGGPKCANDWSWWQVKTESGFIGWMSEGGDNIDKYFLCPGK